jgi:hypothetical protein
LNSDTLEALSESLTGAIPQHRPPGNKSGEGFWSKEFHKIPPYIRFFLPRIFKFLASLRLAIFVLVALMLVFAAGTFMESFQGTEAASLVIYQSFWFHGLLFLLGVNVAAAALDRLPWKRKHTGFVITHLGIILILIGSFISKKWMVDGHMAIAEGESEFLVTLPEPLLYIYSQSQKQEWGIPLKKRPFSWEGWQPLKIQEGNLPFRLSLLSYFPKARMQESLVQARTGPAALKVTLYNSFLNESQWLVDNHPELGQIQVGPARLKFTDELLPENHEPVPESGYLEFQFSKANLSFPLVKDLKLPAQFGLPGMPYKITLLRLFKNAVVVGRELIDQPDEAVPSSQKDTVSDWKNPAAELLLEGGGVREKHTVFAKYPDFPTQHGMKPSAAGVRIYYRLPQSGSRGETHELRFVKKERDIFYQIQTGFEVKTGRAVTGESVKTGWMDLVFRVDTVYLQSEMRRTFSREPNSATGTELIPAIQLEIKTKEEAKQIWLRQGTPEKLELFDGTYHFLFGERKIPAGFRLELRDFRVDHYPGTTNPASFESDVTLKDDTRGIQREATISMNKPLIYNGFRIYQSGYNQSKGQSDISIFAVGRDPGVGVKYFGAVVLVVGMIVMFWMRKFSANGEVP